MILRHNLHGIDIDPRCTQIAALALWPGGDEGMSQEELLDLSGTLEDGPVLAAAIRQVTRRSMPRAATATSPGSSAARTHTTPSRAKAAARSLASIKGSMAAQ